MLPDANKVIQKYKRERKGEIYLWKGKKGKYLKKRKK